MLQHSLWVVSSLLSETSPAFQPLAPSSCPTVSFLSPVRRCPFPPRAPAPHLSCHPLPPISRGVRRLAVAAVIPPASMCTRTLHSLLDCVHQKEARHSASCAGATPGHVARAPRMVFPPCRVPSRKVERAVSRARPVVAILQVCQACLGFTWVSSCPPPCLQPTNRPYASEHEVSVTSSGLGSATCADAGKVSDADQLGVLNRLW